MGALSLALVWRAEDQEIILLMQYICRERGYECQHVAGFSGLLSEWYDRPPAVAVIKRSLDVIDDGLAFCRTIRADARLCRLPIIVGWADMPRQTFESAYEAGANGCFGRVFDIGGVFTMVERLARDPTHTRLVDQPIPRRRGTSG